mmetsp:Transcript_19730/g.35101  ORF Transcript_19730/g.35101 Transcript_19730/m.35101 type:complete len:119 (-) Transcript_19730:68-424(-)
MSCFSCLGFVCKSSKPVKPIPEVLIVTVEIYPDRIEEFLKAITVDYEGSRTEAGCLRFDLFRDKENENKFVFLEVYKDAEAITVHRAMPHFAKWGEFKKTGGVKEQSVMKLNGYDYLP